MTADDSPAARDFLAARDFMLAHRTEYDTAYRDFRWPAPERFNWALDYFDPMARGNDAPALVVVDDDGGRSVLSFAAMSRRSSQVANHLRAAGVARGDRVLVMLPNIAPLWETLLGLIKLGAVIVPATTLLSPADLRDRIGRGRIGHVVVDAREAGKFASVPGDYTRVAVGDDVEGWVRHADAEGQPDTFEPDGPTRSDDLLLLYFTSGTTAQPKLVMHTHASYPIGHLSTMFWLGLQPGDVHLNVSSPGWAKHAWSNVFAPWNARATVLVYNYARFSAPAMLQVLADSAVTTFCAPPTVWRMLIQEDLAGWRDRLVLREVVGAGEPLNPEIIAQVGQAWGLSLRDGYGQTETTALVGNSPGQPVLPGSMGRALPGYVVTLVDPDGMSAAEGEICLELSPRPVGLMTGYEGDVGLAADSMRDGYYHTGDVAGRDADGYITYVGRADDVFKSSDYRISPFELESVLIEHPAVAEAAVVPAPDPLRLSVPKAFVVLVPGANPDAETAQSIFRYTREHLSSYKRIRRLEFAELPKTISGKIRRVELRAREHDVAPDGRPPGEFREDDFPDLRG